MWIFVNNGPKIAWENGIAAWLRGKKKKKGKKKAFIHPGALRLTIQLTEYLFPCKNAE